LEFSFADGYNIKDRIVAAKTARITILEESENSSARLHFNILFEQVAAKDILTLFMLRGIKLHLPEIFVKMIKCHSDMLTE
jgi:hypothetical protein